MFLYNEFVEVWDPKMTSRYWLFTLNNPTDLDTPDFSDPKWKNLVKLAIYQKEKVGTEHLQGYIVLTQPRRLVWMKKNLPRAHLEKRQGTHAQAVRYCSKEDTRISNPILYPSSLSLEDLLQCVEKENSTLSNLNVMKTMIDNGKSDLDLADFDFLNWVKYNRGLTAYRLLKSQPRDHDMHVAVYQGPTGTGKSKAAMELYPGAYWKQRSNWWDGYENQKVVILDEFYGWLPFDLLLRLCDRYPLLVETKGGQRQFVADTIIITTNAMPNSWYKNCYFPSFIRRVCEWHIFPVWGQHAIYTDYAEAARNMINNSLF